MIASTLIFCSSAVVQCEPTPEIVYNEIERQTKIYNVDTEIALRIAKAESNFKATAVGYNTNGSNDKGVFQINSIHKISDNCRLNYICIIRWAMKEMSKNGFGAWYSSKHKWNK